MSTQLQSQKNGNGGQQHEELSTVRPAVPSKQPAVDVLEREDAFVLQVDVPGASQDAIDLRFEHGHLTIQAEVERFAHDDARQALVREFRPVGYRRAFKIGEHVDVDAITAEYDAGVLTVTLPKTGAARPRTIAVKGAKG
jgi:HSP20 family molecular chaperone IbpA